MHDIAIGGEQLLEYLTVLFQDGKDEEISVFEEELWFVIAVAGFVLEHVEHAAVTKELSKESQALAD